MLSSLHLLTLSPSLHLLTLSGLDFFQPAHHEEALPQFCRIQFCDWTINWVVLLGDFWPCPEDPGAGACLRFSNGLPKWHLLFCSSGLVTPAHFAIPFVILAGFLVWFVGCVRPFHISVGKLQKEELSAAKCGHDVGSLFFDAWKEIWNFQLWWTGFEFILKQSFHVWLYGDAKINKRMKWLYALKILTGWIDLWTRLAWAPTK